MKIVITSHLKKANVNLCKKVTKKKTQVILKFIVLNKLYLSFLYKTSLHVQDDIRMYILNSKGMLCKQINDIF